MKTLFQKFTAVAVCGMMCSAFLSACGQETSTENSETIQNLETLLAPETTTDTETQTTSAVSLTTVTLTSATTTTTAPPTTTKVTTTSATTASVTSTQTTTSATEYTPPAEETDEHGMKPSWRAFFSDAVFVGDSICSGLRAYEILPNDNVVATGNCGAKTLFDFLFPVRGYDLEPGYALSILQPKYVIFSMGMNDIRWESQEEFCNYYLNMMDVIQNVLPEAKLYAASITPLTAGNEFATNEYIDGYNGALKNAIEASGKNYTFLNISSSLKNEWNALSDGMSGGDGIHLSPDAYYTILRTIGTQLVDSGTVSGISKDGVAYGQRTAG